MFHSVLACLLVTIAINQLSMAVTTVYLHRALSHRAITLSPSATAACRIITWCTTGIRPRQWVAVHRKHHAKSDEEGDPHSPVLLGYLRVQLGNAVLYRRVARDQMTVTRYASDLPPDRWDKLFDHAIVGLGLGVALLCVLFGLRLGLIAALVHAVAYLLLNAAVNAIGHLYGKRSYVNLATNSQWLAWLTMGEGLHNNHHAAPSTARLAHRPRELDPGWWIIWGLQRLRLATVRLKEPKLISAAI